jgi:Uncharacterized protein conserved in bacteria (DUF2272)
MPIHSSLPAGTFCAVAITISACQANVPSVDQEVDVQPNAGGFFAQAGHSPPFARTPYEPFTRSEAIAIAQQEWRLFGQRVYDDPPHLDLEEGPQRLPGLWERIGEYWWLGQDANRRESGWTGMHDEGGQQIDDSRTDYYAWSAAFVSYVMRTAGAGGRFPYAPSHYVYINIGKEMKLGRTSGWAVLAERPDAYAPIPGDLICFSRTKRPVTYDKLPVRRFTAHCDIVVAREAGQIEVIGGNVDHAVTLKHVPVTGDGRLAESGDRVLDARYPWFVALRVQYDR